MRKTIEMIEKRAGKRPVGWRSCTQSPNSLELLMEHGFLWNSNSFAHDLPFVWEKDQGILAELPRHPFVTGVIRTGDSGTRMTPRDLAGFFDDLLRRVEKRTYLLPFSDPPLHFEPAGRAKALKEMIHVCKSTREFGSCAAVRSRN